MQSLSAAMVSFALLGLLGPAAARTDVGGVPKFDVSQSCREAQTIGGDDRNLAYKGCMQDEKDAEELLAKKWAHFKAEDRRNCIEQGASPMPSYVEILTCLEMYDGASTFNSPSGDSRSLGGPASPAASPSPSNPTPPADSGSGAKF